MIPGLHMKNEVKSNDSINVGFQQRNNDNQFSEIEIKQKVHNPYADAVKPNFAGQINRKVSFGASDSRTRVFNIYHQQPGGSSPGSHQVRVQTRSNELHNQCYLMTP